jgi:hypothetical protein
VEALIGMFLRRDASPIRYDYIVGHRGSIDPGVLLRGYGGRHDMITPQDVVGALIGVLLRRDAGVLRVLRRTSWKH